MTTSSTFPIGLADCCPYGERGVVVDEQVADHHRRPEGEPAEVEKRDADADGQPHDRGDRPGELE